MVAVMLGVAERWPGAGQGQSEEAGVPEAGKGLGGAGKAKKNVL